MVDRLTGADAYHIERFVGYTRGNLNGFSHASMRDFVVYECGYPSEMWEETAGLTKGPRLRRVVETAEPVVQKEILRRILARFPEEDDHMADGRSEVRPRIRAMLARLDGVQLDPMREGASTTAAQALADAEVLVAQRGPAAGLDRLHTAIHDYMLAEATKAGIPFTGKPGLQEVFGLLRAKHAAFQITEPWEQEVIDVLRGLARVLEGLNSVRNNFSRAHPNESLPEPEARLLLDASRAFLNYLNQVLDR